MSAWLRSASSGRRAGPATTARGDHRLPGAVGPGAYASVASSAVIWGSIGLVVRLVHMSALAITFYRVVIGAVSILFVLLLRGQLRQLRPQSRRKLAQLALMAGLYTVNWVLYFYAVKLTTVGNAALAYYTAPAFMALFGALFLQETLDRRTLLYVATAFAGLYVLLDPSRLGGARLDGILAGVGAGIAYAAAVVTAKPLRTTFTPWSVAAYQTTGATLLLAPCLLLFGGSWSPRTTDWAPLLALGLVHTIAAFWLFFAGIKNIPTKQVGFIMYLDPLTAVLLSGVALGEPLTISTLLGGTLILAAGLLALKRPHISLRHNARPADSKRVPAVTVTGGRQELITVKPAPTPGSSPPPPSTDLLRIRPPTHAPGPAHSQVAERLRPQP